jgi:hypothetical protein
MIAHQSYRISVGGRSEIRMLLHEILDLGYISTHPPTAPWTNYR